MTTKNTNAITPKTVGEDEITKDVDGVELEELRIEELKQAAGGGDPKAWG